MIVAASAGNVLVWIVWIVAAFACLGSGIAVVSFSNPFYSALALIANLGSLAVLYLLLSAEFVAAAQVLIYAGSCVSNRSRSATGTRLIGSARSMSFV